MSLIKSFEELIPDQFGLYEQLKEELEPSGRLTEAIADLEQALKSYDPLRYENKPAFQALQKAIKLLKEPAVKQKDEQAQVLLSLAYGWKASMKMAQNKSYQALKSTKEAIEAIKDLFEDHPWYAWLQGANYILLADLEQQSKKKKLALEDYEYGISLLEKAANQQEKETQKRILASLQRAHRKAGTFLALQDNMALDLDLSKSEEHYLESLQIGKDYPESILCPALFLEKDDLEEDEEDIVPKEGSEKQSGVQSMLFPWFTLFFLIDPDLEEIRQLCSTFFMIIATYLENKNESKKKEDLTRRERIDHLETLFTPLLDLFAHPLTVKALGKEKNSALKKEFLKLQKESQKALKEAKKQIRENKKFRINTESAAHYFSPDLVEEEMEQEFLKAFQKALNTYEPGTEEEEKQALEKALIYAQALTNHRDVFLFEDRYQEYLYEIEKHLATFYRLKEKDRAKAIYFFERAAKRGGKLVQAEYLEAGGLEWVHDELVTLYMDDGNDKKMYFHEKKSAQMHRKQRSWERYIGKSRWDRDISDELEELYGSIDSIELIKKIAELD